MNPKIPQHLVGAAIGIVIIGAAIRRSKKIIEEGQQERAKIRANSIATITAMRLATDIIKERIAEGYYDGKSVDDIRRDWDFENIAIFNKEED